MGWAKVVGHSKWQFQTTNLLEVDSETKILKINILQVAMFQNVLMDPNISKEKQISLFFSMFFGIFVSFQFHAHIYMWFHTIWVISFEYVEIISRDYYVFIFLRLS